MAKNTSKTEDTVTEHAKQHDGMDYVIVRGRASGVFAGYLAARNGCEVVLRECRRLWYWKGAASLSELAVRGVSCPSECKFPVAVESEHILDVIEVIPCTETARESISNVREWTVHDD